MFFLLIDLGPLLHEQKVEIDQTMQIQNEENTDSFDGLFFFLKLLNELSE